MFGRATKASTKARLRSGGVPVLVLAALLAGPQAPAAASPPQLTISSPPAWTNAVAPVISGTSGAPEYPVEVTIYSAGLPVQTLGPLSVSSEGTWEATALPMLPGEYTAIASQPEDATASDTFTIDTQAPSLSIVAVPTPSNDATPTLHGKAGEEPGDHGDVTVTISSAGGESSVVVPVVGEEWTYTPSPLADGTYTAEVAQEDEAGNVSRRSAGPFIVDTAAPAVSMDAVAAFTADATPQLGGAAGTAGGDASEVVVTISSGSTVVLTEAVSVSGGRWAFVAPSKLADGTYTARVSQADAAGNVGQAESSAFTIDTTAPAVSIEAVQTPTNDSTPTLHGTAGVLAGDAHQVTVELRQQGGKKTTATASVVGGKWSYTPAALADGAYTAEVLQEDEVGNVGSAEAGPFTIDTTAPAVSIEAVKTPTNDSTPTLHGAAGGLSGDKHHVTVELHREGGATTTVSVSVTSGKWSYAPSPLAEGAYVVRVVQEDEAGNVGSAEAGPFTIDTTAPAVSLEAMPHYVKDSTPTLGGGAGTESGDGSEVTVKVYRGESTAGTLSASGAAAVSDGRWSYTAPPLADGTYTAEVTQSDAAGNVGTSKAVTFTVDTTAPAVSIEAVKTPTNDSTPTLHGAAGGLSGDKHHVTVELHREGGATTTVSVSVTSGKWSYAPSPLAEGAYVVRVVQEDEAGNVGSAEAGPFTIDTTAPVVSLEAMSAFTSDRTPTLGGAYGTTSGDLPEVKVTIYRGLRPEGTVAVSGNAAAAGGSWSYEAPFPLTEGSYTAVVAQADEAGNVGESRAVTFAVDAHAPFVAITRPEEGQELHTVHPAFSGVTGKETGDDPNVRLLVYRGAGTSGPLLFDPLCPVKDGKWSTEALSLANGVYTAVVELEDQAGNVGRSEPATFSVQTNAPTVTLSPAGMVTRAGSLVSLPLPSFSGSGSSEPNDAHTVEVEIALDESGEPVENVDASLEGGVWHATAATPLADGRYTALATQKDTVSGEGVSAPVTFTVDSHIPHVTLTAPVSGASAAVAGAAGTAPGDQPNVTVALYSGSAVSGTPIQSVTLPVVAGAWSGAFGGLAAGTYTARAEQVDDLGTRGYSAPVTFSVAEPAPPQQPAPAPPPNASFRWFPTSPHVGEPVSLVSTSSDPAAAITGYAWGLSPGAPLQSGSDTTSTSFATPGDHLVTLRIVDAAGRSAEASETIAVTTQPLVLMQPFPVVRIAGTAYRSGTRLSLFSVQAPLGARVSVSCSGPGCPAKAQSVLAASRHPASSGAAVIAFRRFLRLLRPGTVLQVKVFKAGEIGKYTRFAVRRGKLPTRLDACLGPAGTKPIPCPSA